ncbi:hypothetical protein E0H86_07335 [Acinetobacter sp. ANC 4635]|uniref:hypothetical protein n=1 Tax=Acinetobacter sp. ANC 4635 TaxID=2529846 RepID=UPI00104025C4|nr:hypothetical protein [Acinetobacter sp. ANC 4635]TCB32219.1 hypothetical protein E0H86_07335 [Acinetobacter sp. ANC 4635]
MNTEDKAHEYAKILLNHIMSNYGRLSVEDAFNIAKSAYMLADAMLEVQGRKPVERPAVLEEWQPNWSLAPESAQWWAMAEDRSSLWFNDEPRMMDDYFETTYCGFGEMPFREAPNFNYKGDWRNSLRKRPDGV